MTDRKEPVDAMLWEVLIRPFEDQPDREAGRVLQEGEVSGGLDPPVRSGHSFLIQTASDQQAVSRGAAACFVIDCRNDGSSPGRERCGAVFEGMEQAVVSAIKKQVGEASQIGEFAINAKTGNSNTHRKWAARPRVTRSASFSAQRPPLNCK